MNFALRPIPVQDSCEYITYLSRSSEGRSGTCACSDQRFAIFDLFPEVL